MLLDDDIVTDGEAQAGAFAGWFGRKERIEHLVLHLGRDTGAVITNPDLHAIAQVSGCGGKGRFVGITVCQIFTLGSGVETV